MAEANAISAMPRYRVLLNQERAKVETFARSLKVSDEIVREFLVGVDKRHARFDDFNEKMMSARAEFYRAFGGVVAIMIEQFGAYKVQANGQFLFSNQSNAARYTAAASALQGAAKRVDDLTAEGEKLLWAQQEGWAKFTSGK